MNPIINQMFGNSMGNFMSLFNTVKNAQNPNAMLQSMAQNNPQLKTVLETISQNGGNAKELFYKMAQQKGIDPNTIINQVKNM